MADKISFLPALSEVEGSALKPEEIREQLVRLLSSKSFRNAKRLSEFLRFSVEETLAGRGTSISAPTIAVEVFGRSRELDLKSEGLVRVQARQLRLKLDSYYAEEGANDPIKISIPQGAYTSEFEENNAASRTVEQKLTIPIPTEIGVYITPIEYPENNLELQFAAKVLAHELTGAINPFSACRAYSVESDNDSRIIQQPAIVLEGFLAPGKGTLALLVHAKDNVSNEVVWTHRHTYSGPIEEITDWITSSARRIAINLVSHSSLVLANCAKGWFQKADELDQVAPLVFRGHRYASNPDPTEHLALRAALELRVAQPEPRPEALALLSLIYLDECRFRYNPTTDPGAALQKALECAEVAVSEAPNVSDYWLMLSGVHSELRNVERSRAAAEMALDLNPNSTDAMVVVGLNYWALGWIDEGLKLVNDALDLNDHPPGWYHLCRLHEAIRVGELERAEALIVKVHMTDFFWLVFLDMVVHALQSKQEVAQKRYDRLKAIAPQFVEHLSPSLAEAPFPADFKQKLAQGVEFVQRAN